MESTPVSPVKLVVAGFLALLLLMILSFGGCAAEKSYSRYQQRADRGQNRQQALYDANNTTKVNAIKIAQTGQLVKVAQQQADIRYENAIGVRKAQDEISSTLTPLYVQFEMVQVLEEIAKSGQNNSVIFIPTGPDGRPVAAPQINAVNPHATP